MKELRQLRFIKDELNRPKMSLDIFLDNLNLLTEKLMVKKLKLKEIIKYSSRSSK